MATVEKKDNKPAALDHALYEMIMLIRALPPLFDEGLAPFVRSGWLEVFAIHARNLNEFFGKKNQRREYMKPADFVTDWSHPYAFDQDVADRANLQVAHLTYEREAPHEKTNWPVVRIVEKLKAPCLSFLVSVQKQEALMGYQDNRTRTDYLLAELPKLFPANSPAETNANIAPVKSGVAISPRPEQVWDVTDIGPHDRV